MKTLILILMMSVSVSCFSQSITGFFGMNFGSSREVIKSAMLKKPGCILEPKYCTEASLVFSGINFAGRKVTLMSFAFNENNKFHTGKVILESEIQSKVVDLYNAIKSELNEKYFTTASDYEIYKQPYEKGDGYTESAIKLGKADFSTFWRFKNPASADEDNDNVISLKITDNLLIIITYQDGILIDEVVAKNKAKDFKDY